MMNYLWDFSQSETDILIEWMIINVIIIIIIIIIFISLLLLLYYFFFVFLAVERNFWILEVDSFFYWNEMFFNSKKIFLSFN